MTLELPKIGDVSCASLTLCSRVAAPTAACVKLLESKRRQEWITKRRIGGEMVYCRVLLSKLKAGLHLHIDISAPEFFLRGVPTVNARPSEFDAILRTFSGNEVECILEGTFWLERKDAPPFMLTSLSSASIGPLSVQMYKAGIRIKGALITSAEWTDYDAFLWVTVGGKTKSAITRDYLTGGLDRLSRGLQSLIPGRGQQ